MVRPHRRAVDHPHHHRALLAPVCLAIGGLAASNLLAVPTAAARPVTLDAASGAHQALLRPDADVQPFTVLPSGSAFAALDDVVTQPAQVDAGNLITASSADSSTTVRLSTTALKGAKPAPSRVWFSASTGDATRLRVEVVARGVVRGSTTLDPGEDLSWHSLGFTPKSQAEVNDLQLRFSALDGDEAQVAAAYVRLSARGRKTVTLRPNGDVKPFTALPAGPAAGALDRDVTQPALVSGDARLRPSGSGNSSTVTLDDVDLAGAALSESRLWFYANTGSGTTLRVDLVGDRGIVESTSVRPKHGFAWRSVPFVPTDQSAVDDLQVRFTAVGGAKTDVRAAYVDLQTFNANADYVNNYLRGLPPVAAGPVDAAPVAGTPVPSETAPLPDPSAPSGQSRYQCSTTPYSATTAPEKIVVDNPDVDKLWVGGLLQGGHYADGLGSLADLPIRQRAPETLYLNLLGGQVSTVVPHPDAASVQQGLANLIDQAKQNHTTFPFVAHYDKQAAQSSTEALLKLGVSAKYLGASAAVNLNVSQTAQESTVFATFEQRMFTVAMPKPQNPDDYFTADFGKQQLDDQEANGAITRGNPPVVITSITYGKLLTYALTYKASTSEIEGALDAAYGGGAASGSIHVSARQQEILQNGQLSVLALGGTKDEVRPLLQEHAIGDYFNGADDPASAVPISYQVDNVVNGTAAKFTETSSYKLTECAAIPNHNVVVGARVRMSEPRMYLDKRSSAAVYGHLEASGGNTYDRSYSRPQDLKLHTVTPFDSWKGNWQTVETDLRFDGSDALRLSGSLNCRLYFPEFPPDPSNQYGWSWRPNGGSYGDVNIAGGSAHCPITVKTTITKLNDLTEPRP